MFHLVSIYLVKLTFPYYQGDGKRQILFRFYTLPPHIQLGIEIVDFSARLFFITTSDETTRGLC